MSILECWPGRRSLPGSRKSEATRVPRFVRCSVRFGRPPSRSSNVTTARRPRATLPYRSEEEVCRALAKARQQEFRGSCGVRCDLGGRRAGVRTSQPRDGREQRFHTDRKKKFAGLSQKRGNKSSEVRAVFGAIWAAAEQEFERHNRETAASNASIQIGRRSLPGSRKSEATRVPRFVRCSVRFGRPPSRSSNVTTARRPRATLPY